MGLAIANKAYRNAGAGRFYLFPYPVADPGTTAVTRLKGFFDLLCADDGRRVLVEDVNEYGVIDADGLNYKPKPRTKTFDYCDGSPDEKIITGMESAELSCSIHDADVAHWADVWGVNPNDILPIAASVGKAGRKAVLLGTPKNTQDFVAFFRQPSPTLPGEFIYQLWPRVSMLPEPDIKYGPKGDVKLKITFQVKGDLYLVADDGSPVFHVPEEASAKALP